MLHEEIRSEAPPEPVAVEATPTAAPPPAADDVQARTEARRARLAQLNREEASHVDRLAQVRAQDKLARDLAAAQKRAAELEASAKTRVERDALKDPMMALQILEEVGLDPVRLAEATRERIANPERVAAQAAARAVDPKIAAMEKALAEANERINAFVQQQQAQQRAAEEQAQAHAFLDSVAKSEEHPLAGRFLSKGGAAEFLRLADRAASELPEGVGAQALLDHIEEKLTTEGRRIAQQFAELYDLTPSQAPAPQPHAAAQATTLTNSLAQTRASVVEPEDWSSLPYEERVARAKGAAR